MSVRVGIDTGGTFTDVVAIDSTTGLITATKTSSTPADPSVALRDGLDKALGLAGTGRTALEALIHGTTVATNALLEERIHSLALITTEGFRHVLEIARQSVPQGYGNSYFWVKPDRIVSLDRVFEVSERLNFRGEVIRALDEESVRRLSQTLIEHNIQAAAISLIHAYANPSHERRVRELLLRDNPGLVVSLSSDVLPEYREYERTLTTCIDAYVKPVMERYIDQAISGLALSKAQTPFLIMQSNGGVLSASEVAKQPVTTLLSGPAAGAIGASYLAGLGGYDRVLTVDAGGTSTDICLVDGGTPHITTVGSVGRFTVKLPMVDITTIGTGGGSIAWLDASGGLHVGPKSAGADPGPMAYGKGGTEPTLTDANVVLGRLSAELLGGEMQLDVERARQGISHLADQLGLSVERTAHGIVEIADWNQVHAIRQVTVKRGIDPREYVMVAYGGSGPLQAPGVAELLGMDEVVIPPNPGNVSAFGLLAVDLRTDYAATLIQREDRLDLDAVNEAFAHLQERASDNLARERVPEQSRQFLRTADLRYFGEAYEVSVPVPSGVVAKDSVRVLIQSFHREHVRLYGYSYEGEQLCEVVTLRLTGVGMSARPTVVRPAAGGATSVIGERKVCFDDSYESIPVFNRVGIDTGGEIAGPCVVQEFGSTTIVPGGWRCRVDVAGNLILASGARH